MVTILSITLILKHSDFEAFHFVGTMAIARDTEKQRFPLLLNVKKKGDHSI